MLWLTGAMGLLWWSIAADWLLSLAVTFIVFVLLSIQTAVITGRALDRTEIRHRKMRGGTCLWVFSNPGHPTGLVRSEEPDGPGHNVNRRIRLSGHWYYVSED